MLTLSLVIQAQSISYNEKANSWYYIYDHSGKITKTDTFTCRNGSWIYTWSKDGKKISERSSKKRQFVVYSIMRSVISYHNNVFHFVI